MIITEENPLYSILIRFFILFLFSEIKLNLIVLYLMLELWNGDFSVSLFSFGSDLGELTSLLKSSIPNNHDCCADQ